MTNVTERIKEGVTRAIQYLENGDSVRRACQKAGISVTSLYHNSTAEQREQAYLKNSAPASNRVSRGPGRRRKVQPRQQLASNTTDITQLQKEIQELNEYIVKLEHMLVKTVVLNDNSH